ncbi:MAG: hypothetical protein ACOYOS_00090 [Syntrophales bacterium]
MGKITEDELAMLSPEEREALDGEKENKSTEEIKAEEEAAEAAKAKEEGAGEARRAIEKNSADEKTDEEKAAEAAKETQEAQAAQAAEAEKLEKEAKAKAEADAEEAAAAAAQAVQAAKEAADLEAAQKAKDVAAAAIVIAPKNEPVFTLEAEKKHGTKEEIEAKMTALDTKFDDGDITLAAYNKERAEYVESLTEIKMFDKINAQVQKAASEKGWKDAQADFFRSNPEYSAVRAKNVAFADAVNRLLDTEESKKMTDAQIFEAAKKECDVAFHPAGPPKADEGHVTSTAEKEAAAAIAEEKRKAIEAAKKVEAERAAAVKTLANVPVSEGNQGDDRYDVIDKLTGEAYENAVAKMSDMERAFYATRS